MPTFVWLASLPAKVHRRLSDSAFFIYAFHGVPILLLSKLLVRTVQPHGTLAWLACYATCFTAIVALSITLYAFLQRFLPRFAAFITGGRS